MNNGTIEDRVEMIETLKNDINFVINTVIECVKLEEYNTKLSKAKREYLKVILEESSGDVVYKLQNILKEV